MEKYLSDRHREEIRRRGFYQDSEHRYTTVCVDEGACVFVTYKDGIAYCAFEKAYFPLRKRGGVVSALRFEWIPECKPALARGIARGTSLVEFLRDALVRYFRTANQVSD